jgi:cyclopropane fatty-acyl-phospholipid synthase-like methyltransferase
MSTDERIFLSKARLLEIEEQIRVSRHVARYALLRQYAYGNVLDVACGCGYGTYLLATNPDVQQVIGVDGSPDAIAHAREHFVHPKTSFVESAIDSFTSTVKVDLVISVETLEHLKDVSAFNDLVVRNEVPKFIVTYPSKKTTHYNRFHFHDLSLEQVRGFFPQYALERHFNWEHEFDVCFFTRT